MSPNKDHMIGKYPRRRNLFGMTALALGTAPEREGLLQGVSASPFCMSKE